MIKRHWGKYLLLLAIILPISMIAIFTLPHDKRYIAVAIFPLLFLVLYYSWIALDKRKKIPKERIFNLRGVRDSEDP